MGTGCRVSSKAWLRYPARTVKRSACPTGMERFATRPLAAIACLHGAPRTGTITACSECGGWHNSIHTQKKDA